MIQLIDYLVAKGSSKAKKDDRHDQRFRETTPAICGMH